MRSPMITGKRAKPGSVTINCRNISSEDLTEIGTHVAIEKASLERLGSEIAAIVREIRQAEALPPERRRELRKQKLELLRKISRALERLAEAVDQAGTMEIRVLDDVLDRELGRLLSDTALAELSRTGLDTSFSIHDWDSRSFLSRGGPRAAMESEMAARRQSVLRGQSEAVFADLLRRLQARVDKALALERQNKGGSPGNIYRNFAVGRLALVYHERIGRPTTTPGGPFVTLCELVLERIGLGTEGLEKAVARILAGRQKATGSSQPQPK